MKRIDTVDRWTDKFGAGKDGFNDENLVSGVGGTIVDATWPDHVQEEIANVIEATGAALNNAAYNQLLLAIQSLDAAVAANALKERDLICAANWTEYSTPTADDIRGLAYDPATNRWLACGDSGLLATSDDGGVTWTQRTAGSSFGGTFYACMWSSVESLWVAVGDNDEIQTSPDAVTWTRRRSNAGPRLYGIAHDGAEFIAVGSTTSGGGTALVYTSPAGTTWTSRTPPTSTNRLEAVASDGAGDIVAVGRSTTGGSGRIAYSSDAGVTWTTDSPATGIGELYDVKYEPTDGEFVAAGANGDITSTDDPSTPASWTALRDASSEPDVFGLAALSGGFVVAARGGVTIDPADPIIGVTGDWREAHAPTSEGALCAAFGGGAVLVGLDGGGVLRSLAFGHRLETI